MLTQGMVIGGRYKLLDVLGDGGMARVFRAHDERLGRIVAIKTLHQQYLSQPDFVRRFEQEAQLAAQLAHPNIVAIYDIDRDRHGYYIVMEYVEGGSLKRLITREAPLPLDRVASITNGLGLALDAAHARGVIHRDIKPENILLTPSGQVKVGDFGIARALSAPGQTTTGMVMGSVSYFSPEQAQGQPPTSESDIYSSGIVLYEMLTGRLPFAAGNPLATAMQHLTQDPAPPRSIVPTLPQAVSDVVLKAIAKDPRARYHSGAEMSDALAAAVASAPVRSGASTAQSPTIAVATRKPPTVHRYGNGQRAVASPPRRRMPVLPLALVLLLGGGAAYAYAERSQLDNLLGGGPVASGRTTPTATPRPTSTPQPTTTTAPDGTGGVIAAPSPSATSTDANGGIPGVTATSTPVAGATASSPAKPAHTATPRPTAHPKATATPQPASPPGTVTAQVVTAQGATTNGDGVPQAVGKQDVFPKGRNVYVVVHVQNLPQGAQIGVLWTYPDGTKHPFSRYDGSYATYMAYWPFEQAGHYTVSALVNGHSVGSHQFTVTGTDNNSGSNGGNSNGSNGGNSNGSNGVTPDVASQKSPPAQSAQSTGHGNQHGPKAHKGKGNGNKHGDNNDNDVVIPTLNANARNGGVVTG